MAPGMAGMPRENTRRIQSLRPNVIFLFNTTIKNATEENINIIQMWSSKYHGNGNT